MSERGKNHMARGQANKMDVARLEYCVFPESVELAPQSEVWHYHDAVSTYSPNEDVSNECGASKF